MIAAIHAGRVVDRIGVDEPAVEGVLDPAALGEPEVAALADQLATQLAAVDAHAIVGPVADIGVRLGGGLHIGADTAVPQHVDGCAHDGGHKLHRGEHRLLGTERALRSRRDLDLFQGARVHAAAFGDERCGIVGPTAPRHRIQPMTFGERLGRIWIGIDEDVPVIERGHQPQVRRPQQAVAEHVARHVADADDGHCVAVGILADRAGVTANALPRTAGGDAHRFVVVPNAAAGSKSIAQPKPVLGRDAVGHIAEGGRTLVGGNDEVRVVAVVAHHIDRRHHMPIDDVVGDVEEAGDERPVTRQALGAELLGGGGRPLREETALGPRRHDYRVLDHLRLHEAEHLGPEILAPVTPAQTAAGDSPTAQVDTLDPR